MNAFGKIYVPKVSVTANSSSKYAREDKAMKELPEETLTLTFCVPKKHTFDVSADSFGFLW